MPVRKIVEAPEEVIAEPVENDSTGVPPPTPVETKPKKPRSEAHLIHISKMRERLAQKQKEFARLQAIERKQKRAESDAIEKSA
eukprot:34187-Eustigmatos_ZCMA.PRE.1